MMSEAKHSIVKANVCPAAAPALRTPLSIAGSYASPFAMMGHHEMNGSLTSPSVYPGLISPQMSAAAAAAYGRSPIVSDLPGWDVCAEHTVYSHIMTHVQYVGRGVTTDPNLQSTQNQWELLLDICQPMASALATRGV